MAVGLAFIQVTQPALGCPNRRRLSCRRVAGRSLGPHKIELIYKTLSWGFEVVITDIDALARALSGELGKRAGREEAAAMPTDGR